MNPFERQRLLSALMVLVVLLFVSGRAAPTARWRRPLRRAAIAAFALAVAAALVEIALWWSGGRG
jgi:hypothetical protein